MTEPHSRDDFDEIREIARVLEAMWPDDHRSASYVKALNDKLTRLEEQLEALDDAFCALIAGETNPKLALKRLLEIRGESNPAMRSGDE